MRMGGDGGRGEDRACEGNVPPEFIITILIIATWFQAMSQSHVRECNFLIVLSHVVLSE